MNNYSYLVPDYHLHSCFSSDSDSKPEDIIKTAETLGLGSICFTDHNDLDFPDNPENITFDLNIDDYIEYLKDLKTRYENKLDIKTGVEQGLMPSTCDTLNNYSKEHPGLDFIICSSHVVNNMDPYYKESWKNPDGTYKDENELYIHYFEDMLYIVSHFNDYNVYGHIDYIFRYGPTDKPDFTKVNAENFKEIYFPRYKDIIYEILKNIVENGKGIEINTGSLYRGMDYAHPHIEILKLYKELGGEIITFGSDAHDLTHIGYQFKEASEMISSMGFRYFSTFKDMKPDFHNLSD